MLTTEQKQALIDTYHAAKESGHLFPDYAACEVMDETAWGTSESYLKGNNCFGEKQTHPPIYETVTLPTKEFLHGEWRPTIAAFISYPTKADSFRHRMATLQRLAPEYPHYKAALVATTGEEFIREVCQTWSTDPNKATTVLAIHAAHGTLLV